jgi:hypothetical protein
MADCPTTSSKVSGLYFLADTIKGSMRAKDKINQWQPAQSSGCFY